MSGLHRCPEQDGEGFGVMRVCRDIPARVGGTAAKIVNKQMPVSSLHDFPFIYLYVYFALPPDSGDGAVMLWWPPARDLAPVLRALISPLRSYRESIHNPQPNKT